MIQLDSMAVAMPHVESHPNRRSFRGVLTTVDTPSNRSPSGAKGHLVVLTREAAEAALPSLLGMALDYSPTLDRHDVRRKVGVITRAEIVGRNLELGGYLFARDFPEIVEEIEKSGRAIAANGASSSRRPVAPPLGRACLAQGKLSPRPLRQGGSLHAVEAGHLSDRLGLRNSLHTASRQIAELRRALRRNPNSPSQAEQRGAIRAESSLASSGGPLGLSYEVTDVLLGDSRAKVWTLEKVTFTGAAILRRDKAAYRDTWIELSD